MKAISRETGKRLMIFAAGILIYGFSVGLMAAPNVGVSPISSIAYCMTYLFPGVSLGTTQLIVNTVMVLIEAALLSWKFPLWLILQLPASLAFSAVIDLTMPLVRLISGLGSGLVFRWLLFLVSVPVMAVGLFLFLKANLVMLPGDGLAKTLAKRLNWSFGKATVWNSSTCVVITCILSLVFLKRLVGIQLGTMICALTLGRLVNLLVAHSPKWLN